jgi:hypothetical protein
MTRDHYKGIPKRRNVVADPNNQLEIEGLKVISDPGKRDVYAIDNTITDELGSVNIYVDGVSGSDDNSGLSESDALLTIGAVRKKFPDFYFDGARAIVHLAGVGGFGSDATGVQQYSTRHLWVGGGGEYNSSYIYRGPSMVPFSPATGTVTPTLVSYETVDQGGGPDGSGLRTKLTFSSPGWTTNDFLTDVCFLRVTRGGNLVIFEAPITTNDADSLTLDIKFAGGVFLVTDTYEIVIPGVTIVGPSSDFNLSQVTITGNSGMGSLSFNNPDGPHATFERINFKSLNSADVHGLSFDRCSWETFVSIRGGWTSTINTKAVAFGVIWSTRGSASLPYSRKESVSSPVGNLDKVSQLIVVNGPLYVGEVGAHGYLDVQYGVGVYNAANGIIVSGPSVLYQHPADRSPVTGSGISGIGVRTMFGGQALVAGGVRTTIAGTGGDAKPGQSTAVSWGTGAGEFEEGGGIAGVYVGADSSVIQLAYA